MRVMRSKALAWTLLATSLAAGARADEPKAKPRDNPSAGEHVERAGKELDAAGRKAADEAQRAAEEARHKAQEAARDTREQVQQAAERTRQAAHEASKTALLAAEEAREQARKAAAQTGEAAREVYEQGKEQTREALERAREGTRELLLQAADALSPEARARAQEERKQRWAELRARLHGQPEDPAALGAPTRAELAKHARRVARLERVRAVALEQHDDDSAARVAQLLDKENARHEKRIAQLTGSTEVKP
jgi:hypothetical protein